MKKTHAGFKYGFIGGALLVMMHIILLVLFDGEVTGDWIAFLIALFVYFFIGRAAAESARRGSRYQISLKPDLMGAGVGAGLVSSIIVWIFIILRGIVRDAMGITIAVDPIGLCVLMLVDIGLSMALGGLGARSVKQQHRSTETDWTL